MSDASSEELLQFIYQAPLGLVQTTLNGDISLMTPMASQLLMPFAKDASIENIFDALATVAPELRNIVLSFEKKRGKIIERRRCAHLGVDGGLRGVIEVAVNKLGKDRLVVSLQDVTKLVESENAALLNATMMESIVDNIRGQKVCVLDRQGEIVSWNASGERLNGFVGDELIGESYLTIADVTDGDGVEEKASRWRAFLDTVAEEGVSRVECPHRRKDGSTFWAESVVTSLRDATTNQSGFLVVSRDVTAERAREAELRRLASTDPLTGALNRRAFFELAAKLIENDARDSAGFCVAMLDIDHFKRLNDSYGHAVGDRALAELVDVCKSVVRSTDLICRFGGEEFLIFSPGASLVAAVQLAERLRLAIANIAIDHNGDEIGFTASIGVAASDGRKPIGDVIEDADKALYNAKRNGRDRVVADPAAA